MVRRPVGPAWSATPVRRAFGVTTSTTVPSSIAPGEAIVCKPLEVTVGDKGIERAIKNLKRKMAAEGVLRELKRRRHYMKPSVKRRKKASEAARRRRKRTRVEGGTV
jgi:small subunit ribosomal protein S21